MLNPSYQKNEEWLHSRLKEIDWDIKRDIINILDNQHDLWKDFFAVLPEWLRNRISLPQLTQQACGSPSWGIMQKMEQWGFTVAQLIVCLEMLNLENALMIIKPNVDLEITEDVEENKEIEVGEQLCLTCLANGFPTPQYQWYRDEEELLLHNTSTLKLEEAKFEDTGSYYCKVYTIDRITNINEASSLTSKVCKVTVVEPPPSVLTESGRGPVIDVQPRSPGENLSQGCSFVLKCEASGDLPISYQWFKDNQLLPAEIENELHISDLFPDETGNSSWQYLCLVTNPFGKIVSNTVTVGLNTTDVFFTARDKVALLIANEQYDEMESFTLPSNDVATLAKILQEDLRFRVMSYLNLTLSEMKNAVHHFCSELGEGVYACFYFAGHGFQDQGQSFMQPVDASKNCAFDENLCVDEVASQMQSRSPALSFLLLDMCRERPDYESNPEIERRLARCYQQKKYNNIVFGYATSFLGEAVEVEGHSNGLFVSYLKKHLADNKSVNDILWHVNQAMGRDPLARREGQDPVVQYNNSEARCLKDLIHNPRPERAVFDAKWQDIYRYPSQQDFKVGTIRFVVTFRPHKNTFCNALDMVFHFKNLGEDAEPFTLVFNFHPKTLRYERHLQLDLKSVSYTTVTIKGLQQLNEPVHYKVVVYIGNCELQSEWRTFSLPGLGKLNLAKNMLSD